MNSLQAEVTARKMEQRERERIQNFRHKSVNKRKTKLVYFSFSVTIKESVGMDIFHPVFRTYSTDSEWNRKRITYFASTFTLLPLLPSFQLAYNTLRSN